MFDDPQWSTKFPPILTPEQAADLLSVPLATIYDWSSRGLLGDSKLKAGRHLRIKRDRLIEHFQREKP